MFQNNWDQKLESSSIVVGKSSWGGWAKLVLGQDLKTSWVNIKEVLENKKSLIFTNFNKSVEFICWNKWKNNNGTPL